MSYLGFSVTNPFRSLVPKGFYDAKKGHTGVDYAMSVGTLLTLPIATEVFDIRAQTDMGNCVYLKNPQDGVIMVFAHNSEILVKIGEKVTVNQIFAKSGNTGVKTTLPHVHAEVIAINPTLGLEFMTRTLGKASGFNIDFDEYLEHLTMESSEELEWLKTRGVTFGDHKPMDTVTWGELSKVLFRLTKKVLEWARTK